MTRFRKEKKQERLPCAQMHSDDGIDPREFFRKSRRGTSDRKDRQLCKQVFRALSCAMAGEFGDPLLQDLVVDSVEPAPDASRLLVTVRLTTLRGQVAPEEVLQALGRVKRVLRCQVAATISRRRVPDLAYRVAGPEEVSS